MRGVNKLIVEIKDTENECFDRAILFLKPDKITANQQELNESAQKLLYAVKYGKTHSNKKKIILIIGAAVLALTAAAVLLLI